MTFLSDTPRRGEPRCHFSSPLSCMRIWYTSMSVCGLPLPHTSSCSAVVKLAQQEAGRSIWSTSASTVFSGDSAPVCMCVSVQYPHTNNPMCVPHELRNVPELHIHLSLVYRHTLGLTGTIKLIRMLLPLSSLISAQCFAGTVAEKPLMHTWRSDTQSGAGESTRESPKIRRPLARSYMKKWGLSPA